MSNAIARTRKPRKMWKSGKHDIWRSRSQGNNIFRINVVTRVVEEIGDDRENLSSRKESSYDVMSPIVAPKPKKIELPSPIHVYDRWIFEGLLSSHLA
jgi:hypothetical protein